MHATEWHTNVADVNPPFHCVVSTLSVVCDPTARSVRVLCQTDAARGGRAGFLTANCVGNPAFRPDSSHSINAVKWLFVLMHSAGLHVVACFGLAHWPEHQQCSQRLLFSASGQFFVTNSRCGFVVVRTSPDDLADGVHRVRVVLDVQFDVRPFGER